MKVLVIILISFLIQQPDDQLPRNIGQYALGQKFRPPKTASVYGYEIEIPLYKIYQFSGGGAQVGVNNREEIIYLQQRITRDSAGAAKAFKNHYLPRFENYLFSRDEENKQYAYSFFDGDTFVMASYYYEVFEVNMFDVWGRSTSSAQKQLPREILVYAIGENFNPPEGADKQDWGDSISYSFDGQHGNVVIGVNRDGTVNSISLWFEGGIPSDFSDLPGIYNHFIHYGEVMKMGYHYGFFDGRTTMKVYTDTEMSNIAITDFTR